MADAVADYVARMATGKSRARRLFCEVARDTCGISFEDGEKLLHALDDAGLTPMPQEPTEFILEASIVAMRQHRRLIAGPKEAAQREKHRLRYRAMVAVQRARMLRMAPEKVRADAP